mmetsp:Transcript_10510/g.31649  ORF Transcript_10510/g.31649 Transcript_10510/m.31649 type:complete len:433 (+) Transcript_10510:255-1553(+)|eukprot:CAMPEP_0206141016 /NCGR_PEP_ID=MMETSP1473-20131121/11533_1 /ASSEMBLY_ACC=CAM_ASM_001109 /TAXON_ID=1461547 /ORGANISM="Stichococcus sp, Strain RCC1054" /LENGTH=432 /DNA_ID=CAMNT_0053535409 /DNA_START=149 /DNA_END=1447 /DNA_ORIENTATION=-
MLRCTPTQHHLISGRAPPPCAALTGAVCKTAAASPRHPHAAPRLLICPLHCQQRSQLQHLRAPSRNTARLRCRDSQCTAEDVPDFESVVLAGDIGGTNCRLTLFKVAAGGTKEEIIFSKTYPTMNYSTFEAALDELYAEPVVKAQPPQSAALAVAGPVINNRCKMTNLKWVIDGAELKRKYKILFAVLNDFAAVGYGVSVVPPEDLLVLNDAPVVPEGPKAVMGPGTGLGEATMVWEESFGGYRVWPSEGSHAAFAPRGWKQRALASFAEAELNQHCEVEHVACGSGLERIVRFLQSDTADLHVKHSQYNSPGEISKAALSGADPIASLAVDMFLCILGAEAGAMGLRQLATGGVYICGGIAPKLLSRIKEGGLAKTFLDEKARFAPILKTFPLFVVLNENLGMLGCRQYALKLLVNTEAQKGAESESDSEM